LIVFTGGPTIRVMRSFFASQISCGPLIPDRKRMTDRICAHKDSGTISNAADPVIPMLRIRAAIPSIA